MHWFFSHSGALYIYCVLVCFVDFVKFVGFVGFVSSVGFGSFVSFVGWADRFFVAWPCRLGPLFLWASFSLSTSLSSRMFAAANRQKKSSGTNPTTETVSITSVEEHETRHGK